MKEWKRVDIVDIPPLEQRGFKENVIIREYIPPIRFEGSQETVVLPETKVYIKRLKTGEYIEITSNEFVIGKGSGSDYVIVDNSTISRNHAKIHTNGQTIYIEDLHSTNHTYVDGHIINELTELENQSELRLSNEDFQLIIIEEE